MLKSTEAAVRAICSADPSINATQIKAALGELAGTGTRALMGEPLTRAYTRKQCAALLWCATKTITNYVRRGLLTPIYGGANGERATCITGASLAAFLEGRTQTKSNEIGGGE